MPDDVAREEHTGLHTVVLQILDDMILVNVFFTGNHEAEPAGFAPFQGLWEDQFILHRLELLEETCVVVSPLDNESGELLDLCTADGRLEIGRFQVVSEVGVYVLVIVSERKLAVLHGEPVPAGVILAGWARTVPSPVPEGTDGLVEEGVVGVDRTALSGGHVVRGIEAGGADVADSTGESELSVVGVLGAEGIAVVLYEPEVVFITEILDLLDVEGVAEGVCDHDRLGLGGEGFLQHGGIDVVLGDGDIHEHGYCTILDARCDSGGESACDGDDLVAGEDPAVAQEGGGEGDEREEVGGGSGVDVTAVSDPKIIADGLFELVGPVAGGEPELQGSVDEVDHLLVVVYPGCVGDAVPLMVFPGVMVGVAVFLHHLQDLFPCLFLRLSFKHLFPFL